MVRFKWKTLLLHWFGISCPPLSTWETCPNTIGSIQPSSLVLSHVTLLSRTVPIGSNMIVKVSLMYVCMFKSYYMYVLRIVTTVYHAIIWGPHEIGNCPNLWLEWNSTSLCFGPWGLIASSNKPPRIRQTMVIPGQIRIWYPMTCWVSPPPRLFTVKTDVMLFTQGKNISHRDAQKVVACTTWAACWTGCRKLEGF